MSSENGRYPTLTDSQCLVQAQPREDGGRGIPKLGVYADVLHKSLARFVKLAGRRLKPAKIFPSAQAE